MTEVLNVLSKSKYDGREALVHAVVGLPETGSVSICLTLCEQIFAAEAYRAMLLHHCHRFLIATAVFVVYLAR